MRSVVSLSLSHTHTHRYIHTGEARPWYEQVNVRYDLNPYVRNTQEKRSLERESEMSDRDGPGEREVLGALSGVVDRGSGQVFNYELMS